MTKKEVIGLSILLFLVLTLSTSAQVCGDLKCELNETVDSCFADCKSGILPPTSLFGQIVDELGRPISNELVTAIWIDEYNKNQSSVTRTLTKRQAEQIGNKKLEGFFLFTEGSIKAKPNSEIEIRTQPRYTFLKVQSQPGRTRDIGELTVFGVSPNSGEEDIPKEKKPWLITKAISYLYSKLKENIKNILLGIVALFIFFLIYREFRRRKRIKSITDFAVYSAIKNVVPTTLGEVMTKKVITVLETETIHQVAHKLVQHKINSVVVVKHKKPIGIVTEIDFLKKVYGKDTGNLKAKDIMSKPLFKLQPKSKILDALHVMVAHKIRKLPVIKNQHLVGIVTLTDLARAINKQLAEKKIKDDKLPHVSEIYEQKVVRENKTTKLLDVVNLMNRNDVDYCILYETQESSSDIRRNVGIITSRDLVEEYYKNPHAINTFKASHIMSTPIISVNTKLNAVEATKIMLQKNIRRLPILYHSKIIGMLTEDVVLEALHAFLVSTKKKIEEYKKIIK